MKVVSILGDCTLVIQCPGMYQPDVIDDMVTHALSGIKEMYDHIPTAIADDVEAEASTED